MLENILIIVILIFFIVTLFNNKTETYKNSKSHNSKFHNKKCNLDSFVKKNNIYLGNKFVMNIKGMESSRLDSKTDMICALDNHLQRKCTYKCANKPLIR